MKWEKYGRKTKNKQRRIDKENNKRIVEVLDNAHAQDRTWCRYLYGQKDFVSKNQINLVILRLEFFKR